MVNIKKADKVDKPSPKILMKKLDIDIITEKKLTEQMNQVQIYVMS